MSRKKIESGTLLSDLCVEDPIIEISLGHDKHAKSWLLEGTSLLTSGDGNIQVFHGLYNLYRASVLQVPR